jgi:hypothetical protein
MNPRIRGRGLGGVREWWEGREMGRDVMEPLEELVKDRENQKHQDCCVQDVGERQSQ